MISILHVQVHGLLHVCGGGNNCLVMWHSYVSLRSLNCHSEMVICCQVKLENFFLIIYYFGHHQALMMTKVIGGNVTIRVPTFKLNLHYNYAGAS